MRRRSSFLSGENDLIKSIQFEYNTELVSKNAFDEHIVLYNNYIKNVNKRINNPVADSYNINAIKLHEMFFQNIGNEMEVPSHIETFFEESFSSFNEWKENFLEISLSAQGSSWALLVYDFITKKFKNIIVRNHNDGILIGCSPVIVLDMFEHSFWADYGPNKNKYVEKFFKCINWNIILDRIRNGGRVYD